ncbi:uncharacterized protein TEOVI_000404700 [Trypanosoma equiperdum]|uniref:BRCT domain-containing protein n=3 Tax=Trypanozoon TaxID=39700 RepID=Q38E24_TRYB2|nr:hypothetical protein, conserved [Trypanosoma brucei brucei TREU927]EAN76946.1 hypothetical protein, conserved [Trypanosoma brucei brucei TREU927]RHW70423.1 hypothetical protein DPX39_090054300 [Trypanosoma brucei equiperdum]SCU72470.1 hypothetical protein, conserved [Trypanosoma equiperdum]
MPVTKPREMKTSAARRVIDPIDSTVATSGWTCTNCSVEVPKEEAFCKICSFARPMDRHGVPQIFTDLTITFNGIIPRSVKHQSHSVEWRMAERHGATCMVELDFGRVNVLVYRPGYERSEKVRKCVEAGRGVFVVPITWMLDCLLQSRQIHPSLFHLAAIPLVPQPTVKGMDLPHHHHPYYVMNVKEYTLAAAGRAVADGAIAAREVVTSPENMKLPPTFQIPELRYTNIDIYEAVCSAAGEGRLVEKEDEHSDDVREGRNRATDIEVFKGDQRNNRVNNALFSGIKFLLTPVLESNPLVVKALVACGGRVIISSHGKLGELLRNSTTHVLYDHSEKKCPILIEAAHVKKTVPGLILVQSNWAEDCMIFKELIPPYGPYAPSAKLMETLEKKYKKRAAA